ncbi:MAG: hypothetical protein GF393_01770 [Armatimonadia bacterium]|nr:hypothetical protein [Armatimonadia bacterium]
MRTSMTAAIVCCLCLTAVLPSAWSQDAYEAWEADLPADYGLTTRDWARAVALQTRTILEEGQPVSDRTLRLYGRPFPGLTWVEDEAGGHVALDPETDPSKVHVPPNGYIRTINSALGPLLNDPNYDPSILGVDREQLAQLAVAIVELNVQQPHRDWDFGGAIKGHGRGPGLYYFWSHYQALRFVGHLLTDEQRAWYEDPLTDGVMGHQMAPRPTEYVHISPWGPAGNSAMEENMWGLDNRIPHGIYEKAVGAEGWEQSREKLNRDLVNACSTWHLQHCTEVVEGRPVNEWATGNSWWADFAITNHTFPDVMYSQNAINTACAGAAYFLDAEGEVPATFMYNFDWVARRFLLPLTLWRGRIYSPNEKERTRYGEAAQYFQAIRLGTYLKVRHRDPRMARLERDCLAFGEWSGRIQPMRAYLANLLSGVEVEPSPDEDLQQWLSGNACLWAHSTYTDFAINRTPQRLAVMGAENGSSDWAVIPREGDWMLSAWGRMGNGAFERRRSWFFGGGFAGLGEKPDGGSHALFALPDDQTVVLMSRAAPGAQTATRLELLSSDLNAYTRRLQSAEGERVLSREADAQAAPPEPLAGPWLNVDDRIGYVVVHPAEARFSHGLHANEAKGEFRIPVAWPLADASDSCTVIVADQTASQTAALAGGDAFRWIDAGEGVSLAQVRGQDGSHYVVAANWSGDHRDLQVEVPPRSGVASVLGTCVITQDGMLSLDLAPRSIAIAQVARPEDAPLPQVRLLAPALDTVFADAQQVHLRAAAAAADGIREVRFHVRQGEVFSPPRLLGTVERPPYSMTWRPTEADRGRYAELWAEAVSEGGVRTSSTALVMIRPE